MVVLLRRGAAVEVRKLRHALQCGSCCAFCEVKCLPEHQRAGAALGLERII